MNISYTYCIGLASAPQIMTDTPPVPPRPVRFQVVKAGEFVLYTGDGYEVTLVIRMNALYDSGSRDANNFPLYVSEFEVVPSIRPMLNGDVPQGVEAN